MKFIETPVFTKGLHEFLSDDDYRGLQLALVLRPEQGRVIPGTGGLRKMRWKHAGRGKRSGLRVIYYRLTARETIYLLLLYEKSGQDDLTPHQTRTLRRLVNEELA